MPRSSAGKLIKNTRAEAITPSPGRGPGVKHDDGELNPRDPAGMKDSVLNKRLCSRGPANCESCQLCAYGRERAKRDKAKAEEKAKEEAAREAHRAWAENLAATRRARSEKYEWMIEVLRDRMYKRGESISSIAAATGIARSSIYKWLNGMQRPGLMQYCEVMEHMGIRVTIQDMADPEQPPMAVR